MGAPHLVIGRLARRAGVNVETIRYYERVGLMRPPPRTAGGYRVYGEGDATRLRFIRRARELGFTLDQVRDLLRLAEDREHSCAEARGLASAHLADVRAKLADLRRMERVLEEMVARCADGSLPECPILEALSRWE
jgi:MerR family mercuric resistance operon transcriptional regulator